ncbi:complex III assembly factor LYRM7-like [Pollicipes pollicipes]|uniref:complex III assembly factor LYRM7-like n=1 Tax=Pollicipes pollicipes TaxID=41117 RepID=UPI0018850E34|nr:complex III assembly factor LYRM7-like [Pollicipes pollicipes]
MNHALRTQVISAFKRIHRVKATVFAGDEAALNAARSKINGEYKKNKSLTNETAIKELIQFSKECEDVLKKTVMQATETEPGRYTLRISKDTYMWDNAPYREDGPPAPDPAGPAGPRSCAGADRS